jgi:hypothetical protein
MALLPHHPTRRLGATRRVLLAACIPLAAAVAIPGAASASPAHVSPAALRVARTVARHDIAGRIAIPHSRPVTSADGVKATESSGCSRSVTRHRFYAAAGTRPGVDRYLRHHVPGVEFWGSSGRRGHVPTIFFVGTVPSMPRVAHRPQSNTLVYTIAQHGRGHVLVRVDASVIPKGAVCRYPREQIERPVAR